MNCDPWGLPPHSSKARITLIDVDMKCAGLQGIQLQSHGIILATALSLERGSSSQVVQGGNGLRVPLAWEKVYQVNVKNHLLNSGS